MPGQGVARAQCAMRCTMPACGWRVGAGPAARLWGLPCRTGDGGWLHRALSPGCAVCLAAMKLHNYFRSSASFRVRIALQIKGLAYDYLPVHLVRGEHRQPAYAEHVGDTLVPALETGEGLWLTQSMAIIEYLEETHPAPALLPGSALDRARIRGLAQMVACDIHPLNNLRVLKYLVRELKVDDEAKAAWYRHWVRQGLEGFERQLVLLAAERAAQGLAPSVYCWGDTPTLADCCLVPQIFNGQRFDVDFSGLPLTMAAFDACMSLPAFQQAQPSACPDAAA